jgi:hypothetical protein
MEGHHGSPHLVDNEFEMMWEEPGWSNPKYCKKVKGKVIPLQA